MLIEITPGALAKMTEAQKASILTLARNDVRSLEIYGDNPFGLPEDYLTFTQSWEDSHRIYGGIAPDGQIST